MKGTSNITLLRI